MSAPALFTTKTLACELCTCERQIGRWTKAGMPSAKAEMQDANGTTRHVNLYQLTACWEWITANVLPSAAARHQPWFAELRERPHVRDTPEGIAALTAYLHGVEDASWGLAECEEYHDDVKRAFRARRKHKETPRQ